MDIKSINPNYSKKQNFTGIRIPADLYSTFYPSEVFGLKSYIKAFEKDGRLSHKHADSLTKLLGNDDVHLEKTDNQFLQQVRNFNWAISQDNYEAFDAVIKKAKKLPESTIEFLTEEINTINQAARNEISKLALAMQEIKSKNKDEVSRLVEDTFSKLKV